MGIRKVQNHILLLIFLLRRSFNWPWNCKHFWMLFEIMIIRLITSSLVCTHALMAHWDFSKNNSGRRKTKQKYKSIQSLVVYEIKIFINIVSMSIIYFAMKKNCRLSRNIQCKRKNDNNHYEQYCDSTNQREWSASRPIAFKMSILS